MQSEAIIRSQQEEAISGEAGPILNQIEALRSLAALLLREVDSLKAGFAVDTPIVSKAGVNLSEEIERIEINMIRQALIVARGHQRDAATILGTKATTLNAKIKRYGIEHFSALGKI